MRYEIFLVLPELAESRGGFFMLFLGFLHKTNAFD